MFNFLVNLVFLFGLVAVATANDDLTAFQKAIDDMDRKHLSLLSSASTEVPVENDEIVRVTKMANSLQQGYRAVYPNGDPIKLKLVYLNKNEINLAAAHNGTIIVNVQFSHLLPDAGLLFALAHEMAHVGERHPPEMFWGVVSELQLRGHSLNEAMVEEVLAMFHLRDSSKSKQMEFDADAGAYSIVAKAHSEPVARSGALGVFWGSLRKFIPNVESDTHPAPSARLRVLLDPNPVYQTY